jgi:hypothetical protein
MAGRFDDARAQVSLAAEAGVGDADMDLASNFMRHRIQVEQGAVRSDFDAIRAVCARFPISLLRTSAAAAASDCGLSDVAAGLLREVARDGFAAVTRDFTLPTSLAQLTEVAVVLGTPEERGGLRRLLEPYGGLMLLAPWGLGSVGAADRFLGMLAAADGELDDAIERYRQALGIEEALGARALAARTLLWLARALTARNRPADAAEAEHVGARVRADADALGMGSLATEARRRSPSGSAALATDPGRSQSTRA